MVLDLLLTVLVGWSIGYLFVRYREYDYQKYLPLFFYVYMFCVYLHPVYGEFIVIESMLLGALVCFITVRFTHDPILGKGHKIYKEIPLFSGGRRSNIT